MSFIQSFPEALSDPLPRTYVCFCGRRFTTYPGIYLHLKTKHNDLFFRYKQLKITKLFRKMYDQDNKEIYRLQDLSRKHSHYNGVNQNINNIKIGRAEQSTRREVALGRKNREFQLPPHFQIKPNYFMGIHEQGLQYRKIIENNLLPSPQVESRTHASDFHDKNVNFPHFSAQNHSFGLNPYFSRQPTIRQMMEGYLFTARQQLINKILLRNAIYNLKVFIDKNYELLNDPRVKDRIFLSYCDEFEPSYIGYLLQDYVGYLKSKIQEDYIITSDEKGKETREIQYLLIFVNWLKDNELIKFRSTSEQAQIHAVQQKEGVIGNMEQKMAAHEVLELSQ